MRDYAFKSESNDRQAIGAAQRRYTVELKAARKLRLAGMIADALRRERNAEIAYADYYRLTGKEPRMASIP